MHAFSADSLYGLLNECPMNMKKLKDLINSTIDL